MILEYLQCNQYLQANDAGGSMTIHTFGAYFGLVVSRVLYRPNLEKSKHRNSSVYHSDLFAMIGESLVLLTWTSKDFDMWLAKQLLFIYQALNSHVALFSTVFRYHLSVDVLAQLQLSRYTIWGPPAQNCHEHLLLSGCLHTGYIRFLCPGQPRRQTGHGEHPLVVLLWNYFTSWCVLLKGRFLFQFTNLCIWGILYFLCSLETEPMTILYQYSYRNVSFLCSQAL